MAQNDTAATLEWYRLNDSDPPFDPDGMCLKICRSARFIPAKYPSAVAAQEATPREFRIFKISDITKGMVLYYDDPNDSNPFGHIVTANSWVKDSPRESLHDLAVWTNSVVANKIVLVRGDYFPKHWGDQFVFAATWLNGQELDLPEKKRPIPKPPLDRATRLRAAIKDLEAAVKWHEAKGNTRLVRALRRDIREIRNTIKEFS